MTISDIRPMVLCAFRCGGKSKPLGRRICEVVRLWTQRISIFKPRPISSLDFSIEVLKSARPTISRVSRRLSREFEAGKVSPVLEHFAGVLNHDPSKIADAHLVDIGAISRRCLNQVSPELVSRPFPRSGFKNS